MNWENYSNLELSIVTTYNDKYEQASWEELNNLCLKNDPFALYEKASRLRCGEGIEENIKEAKKCYYEVLKFQKNTRAMYFLGIILQGENDSECFEAFKLGSTLGDSDCTFQLGCLYRDGQFVNNDFEEAIRLFEIADNQGDDLALTAAAEIYYSDMQDYDKAFQLFSLAFQKGNMLAAYYLGKMYYLGLGVDENNEKAFFYIKTASENDIKDGNVILGEMYGFGFGTEKNTELAMKSLDDVDEDDLASSYNTKGRILISESKNEEGIQWLQKSADLGNENSINLLKDLVVKSDEELAKDGSDPYAMIRYSKTLMDDKKLSDATKVITRAKQLYPDNLDVKEAYIITLNFRGIVMQQIGALEESYNDFTECIREMSLLRSKRNEDRLRTIEKNIFYNCGVSAFKMEKNDIALEMFANIDYDEHPYAVVLSALIHLDNDMKFASDLFNEVRFLENAVNSDKWETDDELAMAYFVISVLYAYGITGYLKSDVPRAYSYIQKCAELDPEMAEPEMTKYSKTFFGKITYKK